MVAALHAFKFNDIAIDNSYILSLEFFSIYLSEFKINEIVEFLRAKDLTYEAQWFEKLLEDDRHLPAPIGGDPIQNIDADRIRLTQATCNICFDPTGAWIHHCGDAESPNVMCVKCVRTNHAAGRRECSFCRQELVKAAKTE
jgi:hypothetical protein